MLLFNIPKPLTILAMNKLAEVDYNVATKVSHDVAITVKWAIENNQLWLANDAISVLQFFDNCGGILIAVVVWLVQNTR